MMLANEICYIFLFHVCFAFAYTFKLVIHLTLNYQDASIKDKPGADNYSHALKAYSEISKDMVQELYKFYMEDFILFQYDIEPFLSVAKDE